MSTRTTTLALAVALALSTGAANAADGPKVGVDLTTLTSPFWTAYNRYIIQEAKAQGLDLLQPFNSEFDTSKQITGVKNAIALGASTLVHPPSSGASRRSPCHGRCMLALRPACASWIAARAPCPCRNSTIRASGAMCSSFQIPRSCGVIRPSGSTAAASVKINPAPPAARLPRCTRCQSLANPSVLEYWHMGETAMRFGSISPRKVIGENKFGIVLRFLCAPVVATHFASVPAPMV